MYGALSQQVLTNFFQLFSSNTARDLYYTPDSDFNNFRFLLLCSEFTIL